LERFGSFQTQQKRARDHQRAYTVELSWQPLQLRATFD